MTESMTVLIQSSDGNLYQFDGNVKFVCAKDGNSCEIQRDNKRIAVFNDYQHVRILKTSDVGFR